ncbi:MAG: hypothetical protein SGBAC_005668 [Bacillariaceae sp.]
MVEERKVWLEAHGAMEGVQGSYTIRAEAVDPEDFTLTKEEGAEAEAEDRPANSKLVHFQRHGQGYHNLIFRILEENGLPITDIYHPDPNQNPFVKTELRDAPLTELGRSQCVDQRVNVQALGLNPELVIVSPLHRALLTAQLTFQDAVDAKVPFVAHSGCREELGILTCNWRRPLSETVREFPNVDFRLLAKEGDEDALWSPTEKEAATHQSQRIYDFLVDYVRVQPQSEIAVVGHSAWLFTMCNAVMDCNGQEELESWFGTSEIRSMKLTWELKEEKIESEDAIAKE